MSSPRTRTIGLLTDWVASAYHQVVLHGVLEAVREAGLSLSCFTSGVPVAGGATSWPAHELVAPERLDGLIILATAMPFLTKTEQDGFLHRVRKLPVCSLGMELSGASSVCVDNQAGLESAVDHLVTIHGRRRIAFVGGPNENVEAQQRLAAYRRALEKHGLAVDERLIVSGDFTVAAGQRAAQTLLEERQVSPREVDAVVAANDGMAWGCVAGLLKRGLHVPGQIAVIGFDDLPAGRQARVPLTTVRQPVWELGRNAVRLLLAQMGGAPPERMLLPTELVTRRSCGCLEGIGSLALSEADVKRRGWRSFDVVLLDRQKTLLSEMRLGSHGQLDRLGKGWEARLLSALVDELKGRSVDAFRVEFDAALGRVIETRGDLTVFHEVVSVLWRHLIPCVLAEPALRTALEGLLDGARLNITTAALRVASSEQHANETLARDLVEVCVAVAACSSLKDVAVVVENRFRPLGILRLAIALYPEGKPGSTLHRVLAFDGERVQLEFTELDPRDLPAKALPGLLRSEFIISPLCARGKVFGIVCMELRWPIEIIHDGIRDALSAVMHRLEHRARA
jgi:phosphoserine phosphatase RsbU/P